MAERQKLETGMQTVEELEREAADGLELLELAEGDEDMLSDITSTLRRAAEKAEKAELEALLCGEADGNDCYLNINSGAGGTESQDWASMIRRMYVRWAEQSGYKVEEVESHEGDEAGIKSATLLVKGENAYGWLKSEQGVHRLVRISPFDSSARRHTSFASVAVSPVIDDSIDVEINPSDVRTDTFRASGKGGQHVNKTDSAVRLTHLPTGIVVECQDERSQHKNRARAMSLLQAKLASSAEAAQQKEQAEERRNLVGTGDRSDRIRTYNFPQGRVTDHRINLTLYKLDEVIAGDVDAVIAPLLQEHQADQLAALADESQLLRA